MAIAKGRIEASHSPGKALPETLASYRQIVSIFGKLCNLQMQI